MYVLHSNRTECYCEKKISQMQQAAITGMNEIEELMKKTEIKQEIRMIAANAFIMRNVSASGNIRFIRLMRILPPSRAENGNKLNNASDRLKIAKSLQSGRRIFENMKKKMLAIGPERSTVISPVLAI